MCAFLGIPPCSCFNESLNSISLLPISTEINAKETLKFPPSKSNFCLDSYTAKRYFMVVNAFAPKAMIGCLIGSPGNQPNALLGSIYGAFFSILVQLQGIQNRTYQHISRLNSLHVRNQCNH